ncbi:DUF4097 family beta strand repeat-containing protein [Paenibacillus radicis (ex Gao et al. 2016)]|uniref:DUF4097 domain-containing protein n=1 Tax=Paenibacillus radicis (ex Gao et al. 2016) TaxID=1737354 RepID=A0A917H0R3_9BACL|nr:DUF4097 family beta strand repeat-containing protein [Paenibacillus radicis (ex Gao et al. 2016)]GGG63812.1 hypothetical protein GCM10010918_17270 [Paenibacillus radicis (ex Gao et al. 2016)]
MRKWVASALILLGIGIIGVFLTFDRDEMWNFGTEPYSKSETIDASSARNIAIETKSLNVNVVRGTQKEVVVRLEGRASAKYADRFDMDVEQSGDTLHIIGKYKDALTIGFNFENIKLIVELPEKAWDQFEVKSASGNIRLADIQASQLELANSSGNIKVEDYAVTQLNFAIGSGNIVLEDGTGEIKGDTRSGNVHIDSEQILNPITLKVRSGNVKIESENEPESAKIQFRTGSGNSKVKWSQFSTVNSNDGGLDGVVGSGSGNIVIDVETRSGNLRIQ